MFAKFSTIIAHIGFQRCHYDHSIFVRHATSETTLLDIYMDDPVREYEL